MLHTRSLTTTLEGATAPPDWLVDDQREASGRTNVLVYVSDALTSPVKVTGSPVANPLPTVNHVFLPGHRIMVQVQSSWFPLYDRNAQTFVPNIFWAKPGDYQKAEQRIYREPGRASLVELPVVSGGM